MAGLVTTADLRAWFAISPDIADARLSLFLTTASRRLHDWVGDEAYLDAQAETPADADRRDSLRAAEAHLAMHFALLGLNTVLRPGGVVRQEQVEGGVQIQYLSPSELDQLTAQYLAAAEELVRGYVTSSGMSPGSGE
jgi:hypothetical protein